MKGITESKLRMISIKTNGHCFYCGSSKSLEIDHFVSIKKWRDWELTNHIGSPNQIENLFLACRKCNAKKREKCPEDFIGNGFIAWWRYERANTRIGLLKLPLSVVAQNCGATI